MYKGGFYVYVALKRLYILKANVPHVKKKAFNFTLNTSERRFRYIIYYV